MSIFLDASKKRKWYFRGSIVAATAVVVLCASWFVANVLLDKSNRPVVTYADAAEAYHYYDSSASKGKIALTFDDGPMPNVTRELMDVLEKNDATATFFFIGQHVLLRPDLAHETSERGFTIGIHSFTHQQSVHDSQNRLALELRTSANLVARVTGKEPLLYRPPFLLGIGIDPTINPYIPLPKNMLWALEAGFLPVGADIDPHDWKATSSASVMAGVKSALAASPTGHIMLLHEDKHTAEALPDIIGYVREQGYTIVPLEELIGPPREILLTTTLRDGNTDADTHGEVSKLQWFLYRDGELDPYLITGTFGSETRNALIRFQVKHGLIDPTSVDPARAGVADAITRYDIRADSLSFAATTVLAPLTPTQQVKTLIVQWVQKTYINLFPVFRKTLRFMIFAILLLVITRVALLASLLATEWFRKKFYPEPIRAGRNHGISVLIPAYNEAENIRSTLESVIKNTYSRKEIIVINDGSTDETGAIIKSVIAEHPHEAITLLQVTNGGKASALNHGLHAARYNIAAVLDADAVLDSQALFYFARHFDNPEVGAVAGKVYTAGSKGFLDLFQKLEYAIGQNIDKRALSALGAVGVVPGPAGAWDKRDVLEAGGFSSDTLVEDQDMTLTLLRKGRKVLYESRAIAYTETPHTLRNFLKQRFRWIYGTMQCFWKHKRIFSERPFGVMSLIVMPNIVIFNIILPLTYPFADSALVFGLLFGDWTSLLLPFAIFTFFDLLYAWVGVRQEKQYVKLLGAVPLQRLVYRQLLYITVARSLVRALEGIGTGWNKFAKVGDTQRFYFSSIAATYPSPYQVRQEISSVPINQPPLEKTAGKDAGDALLAVNSFGSAPVPSAEQRLEKVLDN